MIEEFLEETGLFRADKMGVVRLPHLVRGELVIPRKLARAQLVRSIYALPAIDDPRALAAADPAALARELYNLRLSAALRYLARVRSMVKSLAHAIGDPNLKGLEAVFDPSALRAAIDRELAWGEVSGARVIDGWIKPTGNTARVRAMPTRQLHIAAGNSAAIPLLTAARGLALKSAIVVKIPSKAIVAGAVLACALHLAGPEHPLARNTSVVYWRGGDEHIERALFDPALFDRIVVWGGEEAVAAIEARARSIKVVTFRPHYGVSLIGREARRSPAKVARRAAVDTLILEQRSCDASLVHYVEGSPDDAARYAEALARVLAEWDRALPPPEREDGGARFRAARRGELMPARWISNGDGRSPTSAVVCTDADFDLRAHPLGRVVVVRRVARLEDALAKMNGSIATAGVYPEKRRLALRDALSACGVRAVLPLGEAATHYPGMPRNGARPLSEMVNWVSG